MESTKVAPAAQYETCDEGDELSWDALYLVDVFMKKNNWVCARCKKSSSIHNAIAWNCRKCLYCICATCKPLEKQEGKEQQVWEFCPKKHKLVKMTSKQVCDEYNMKHHMTHASWSCDNCRKGFNENSNDIFNFHCSICGFDICSFCRPP